jgi:lipoprotein NlpD
MNATPFKLLKSSLNLVLLISIISLSGCMTAGRGTPAPFEDHASVKPLPAKKSIPESNRTAKTANSSVEPTTKPGYYTVKPGDTLIKIGLDQGQNWRDIIRWNSIENPNLIEVGQILRVVPPTSEANSDQVVIKPVNSPGQVSTAAENSASNPTSQTNTSPTVQSTEDGLTFIWPSNGSLQSVFDESKNKGIDIAGKLGDEVVAAADGRVVYAGSGLRGYGNLIILKHSGNYLTAYAHNQTLLVREDQSIKKGQKIAEMGNSDSEQIKLHFEIRKQGKPVDPLKFLPQR